MNSEYSRLSRRDLLISMAAAIAGLPLAGNLLAQDGRIFSPPLTIGPFYPQIKPLDQDSDLTMIKGRTGRAEGKVIHVAGRVVNINGDPVRGAEIEMWQANTHGRYAHPSDPNKAKLDENFQGYARTKTDNMGRFRFKTIMPGAYPGATAGMRTPHLHFDIHGKTDRIITQMFFPGEKLNETDRIFQEIRTEAGKRALTARLLPPTRDIAKNETLYGWDCVLFTG